VRGSRGFGFNPSLGPVRRDRLLKNYFIITPIYAHGGQGDNPGQEIEGLTMSSKAVTIAWHLD